MHVGVPRHGKENPLNSRMNNRVAFAVLVALVVAVAAGWFAAPGGMDSPSSSAGPDLPSASGFTTEIQAPVHPVDQQRQPAPASDTALTATARRSSFDGAALILAFLIAGAAAIGLVFFSPAAIRTPRAAPQTARGPHRSGALEAVLIAARRSVDSFVERTRRGLGDLHEELQVVLALLQTIDEQVDRLMRVQAGQHATQLVQHRGLVWAQQ